MTPSEIKPGMKFGHWTVIKYDHTNNHRIKYFLCKCNCGTVRSVRGTALIQGTSTACSRRCLSTITLGQKFGRWTVLSIDKSKPKHYWCQCACGTKRSVYGPDLVNGKSKSCGCTRKTGHSKEVINKYKNNVGQRYGKLTVVSCNENDLTYHCKCDCGNEVDIPCYRVASGHTLSCGCQRAETLRKNQKEKYDENVGKKINMLTIDKCFYKNNSFWYDCTCECGNKCTIQATKVVSGYTQSCGCVKSKAEEHMQKILENYNIPFKREYKFENCVGKAPLPFDFAIFNNDDELLGVIELNGQQHYCEGGWNTKERLLYIQRHDKIKHRFCDENNIPLLVIPYQFYDELEKFLITSDFWNMITKNFND